MTTLFDGDTIRPEDVPRLRTQLELVRELMGDHAWWTFGRLSERMATMGVKASEPAISARIRDLRKTDHGGYTIERRRVTATGLHEYRLSPVQKL